MNYKNNTIKQILTLSFCLLSLLINGQTLEDYLKIAEKNSPILKAANSTYKSVLEQSNEVSSLGNTTIGLGYFLQEVETRVGAQKAKLSISQQFPWFGTLSAKKESVLLASEAELNQFTYEKRSLFFNVEKSYYSLFELNAKQRILNENKQLLKRYEKQALIELENNKASMVDVLKIRIEINENENALKMLQQELINQKRKFNLLLNRNKNAEIVIANNILLEDKLSFFTEEDLQKNPKLLQLKNLKASVKQAAIATKKEGQPKIGLGLDYVFVDRISNASIADNGKDIIMPMLSVSLPIFSKKFTSKRKQLELKQKAILYKKQALQNKLKSDFEDAKTKLLNAKSTIKTQEDNIKQIAIAQKVMTTSYETGNIDFEQVIELQQLKLKFELKKLAFIKAWAIQKSRLKFLTK